MSPAEVVRGLSEIAARAGVEVRIEPFALKIAGKGGLCRIGEGGAGGGARLVILVDAALGPLEQAGVLGEALGRVDLAGVDVPPDLAPYLGTGHADVKPIARLRPIARVR